MNGPLSPPYYGPFMQVAPGGGPGQDVRTIQPRILNIAAAADSVAQTERSDFTPVRVRITIDLLVETVLQNRKRK